MENMSGVRSTYKKTVLSSIENICLGLIQNIVSGEDMTLLIPKERDESSGTHKRKKVNFHNNEKRFATLLKLLSAIHELVTFDSYATKRDLYYMDPTFYENQARVDRAIDDICALLQQPRWKLNIMSSSRALAYGDLVCEDQVQRSRIDFRNSSQGTIVSLEAFRIRILNCKAQFVLIIEKDATFQTILDEKLYQRFKPCLIVTGRGIPDVNLRQFLYKVHEHSPEMPMLALMDADPYGLLIYHTYKFNSKNMKRMASDDEIPSLPNLKLIGLLSSELRRLHFMNEELINLTSHDRMMLRSMKRSKAYKEDDVTRKEVDSMLLSRKKAELQTLSHLSRTCLCDFYIPMKLRKEGFLPNDEPIKHSSSLSCKRTLP